MTWDSIQQAVRIVLYALSGSLVTKGYLTEEVLNTLIGAVLALGSVGWWFFWERKRAV